MRAFHDTRSLDYRSPFSAIALGASTTLALDVWDAPNATVMARTWVDGVGEERFPMHATQFQPDSDLLASTNYPANTDSDRPVHYEVSLSPRTAGIVWYQFIISEENGRERRYGALDNRTGGIGRLTEWEPPSFLLAVYETPDESHAPLTPAYLGDVENRTFEHAVVSFLCGTLSAPDLIERIDSLRENHPSYAWDDVFRLLDAPERIALFTQLSGKRLDHQTSEENELSQLDGRRLGLAKGRLWCASLIQTLALDGTLVHFPPVNDNDKAPKLDSIDAGTADAHSSASWGLVDKDCGDIVRNASELRSTLPVFTHSHLEFFAANNDVLGFWRQGDDGTAACVLINASLQNAYDLPIPMANESVSDVLGGYGVPVADAQEVCDRALLGPAADRYAIVHLYQLGTAVLYFHPRRRLGRIMDAGMGVLSHITSLPTGSSGTKGVRQRPGTLGDPAMRFVDWLSSCNVRYWQILPVNPTDEYGSPYAGISAFAGNTRLLENGSNSDANSKTALENPAEYRDFCMREADWLEPYACFMSIRQMLGTEKLWQSWPKKYRSFNPDIIRADKKLCEAADEWKRSQFAFDQQWRQLRTYANDHGVQIIGDMPLYVSADSADAWANPDIFQLSADGTPEVVAGCPPDSFSEDGQIWSNPVYNWATLEARKYEWWMRRLERAFELYDWVRLDHFIGFSRYYSIPNGHKAIEGSYRPGPGVKFFETAFEQFGPLPIIAEDLGSITPAVRALGAACGFPGMDIIQFVDGNDPLSGYQPRPEKIAYTGTHDNQTLVGYCAERYPHLDPVETAEELTRKVASCTSHVCVMPLQDLIGLDDRARMNVPGVAEGNWAWQAGPKEVEDALERIRQLVDLHANES